MLAASPTQHVDTSGLTCLLAKEKGTEQVSFVVAVGFSPPPYPSGTSRRGWSCSPHGIEDGHSGRDTPSRRVNVERDVGLWVRRVQVQELGDDQVRHVVVHGASHADDPLLEQLRDHALEALHDGGVGRGLLRSGRLRAELEPGGLPSQDGVWNEELVTAGARDPGAEKTKRERERDGRGIRSGQRPMRVPWGEG